MSNDKETFEAVQKCRLGQISEEVAATLKSACLLRGVMHIGPPQKMRIVFARARKDNWRNAEEHIEKHLPKQASLRFTNNFGVDFIISGQLPESWADEQLAKRADIFEDVYEVEVIPEKKYRWGAPTKPSNPRSRAREDPSIEDVAMFLSEQKEATRLVYDSSKLPSLSCLAVIRMYEKDPAHIWNYLDDADQLPVRDMFRHVADKVSMDTLQMDRGAIQNVSNYAFCEFDSIGKSEGHGTFTPAMNQAIQWRRRIVDKKEVHVRLIPCAVIRESIDYYDELQESKDRIVSLFEPTVLLPYGTPQTEPTEDRIPFPIWNVTICGGPGSGKSVFAYVLAGELLKEHKFDVVYVNYKNSDKTQILGSQPRKEALDFAGMINQITNSHITLLGPQDLEATLTEREEPGAFYTECVRDIRAKDILNAIFNAHETKLKKHKQWKTFVFFDELLNQKDKKDDMMHIKECVNQWRTSDIYLGIIHQDLRSFWEDSSATTFAEQSTVLLAGKLPSHDLSSFDILRERAAKRPPPIAPVTFTEVKGYQQRQFCFIPTQGANSDNPVRYRLPDYSFFKNLPKSVPQEWTWGKKTTLPSI
jgi:hypothetical protein